MPLPSSRNTTYAAGSPIKSADLNDLQDSIIAGKHGDLVIHEAAPVALYNTGAWAIPAVTLAVAGMISWDAGGAGELYCVVPGCVVGRRFKSLVLGVHGDAGGTADLAVGVFKVFKSGAGVGVDVVAGGTGAINNPPNAWGDFTVDLANTTIDGTFSLLARFSALAAGLRIRNPRWTVDKP